GVDRAQARATAFLAVAAQERLHDARRSDAVTGADAEEVTALGADVHAPRAAAAAVDPHRARLEARLDVAREAVIGLVVVRVGVEDAVGQGGHRRFRPATRRQRAP